jgi:hypothetical protein
MSSSILRSSPLNHIPPTSGKVWGLGSHARIIGSFTLAHKALDESVLGYLSQVGEFFVDK